MDDAPRLLSWLRENATRYDAVIVNGIWQYHSYATWLALHRSETPYFVFTHGMLDPWFKRRHPLKHLKKWLYWPWADYRVLRDAQAVIFTCEEERGGSPAFLAVPGQRGGLVVRHQRPSGRQGDRRRRIRSKRILNFKASASSEPYPSEERLRPGCWTRLPERLAA